MDSLFVIVSHISFVAKWAESAATFQFNQISFTQLVRKFMAKLKDSVHSRLIEDLANDSILELQGNNKTFEHFFYALDAVDVPFQRILVPKKHFHTKMVYYSGKHAAYGISPISSAH